MPAASEFYVPLIAIGDQLPSAARDDARPPAACACWAAVGRSRCGRDSPEEIEDLRASQSASIPAGAGLKSNRTTRSQQAARDVRVGSHEDAEAPIGFTNTKGVECHPPVANDGVLSR